VRVTSVVRSVAGHSTVMQAQTTVWFQAVGVTGTTLTDGSLDAIGAARPLPGLLPATGIDELPLSGTGHRDGRGPDCGKDAAGFLARRRPCWFGGLDWATA